LCSDNTIVEALRRREVSRRKAAVLDQSLISQIARRGVPFARGSATVTAFLRKVLRISPREAHARSKAAERLGPQRTGQGEPKEPIYPTISAAQASGEIRIIEGVLVDYAREHDPLVLHHRFQRHETHLRR
jgi:hypothetical protein